MLTLGPAKTCEAGASRSPIGKCTAPSVVARQLPTRHTALTVWAGITELTCAGVSQGRAAGYRTGSSILTRLRLTHTEPVLTPPACETRFADTQVIIRQLDAIKAVGQTARVGETLIYVSLTSFSCKTRGAVAAISTHSIHTGAIVQTLWRRTAHPQGWSTIVLIDFTQNAQCARGTGADIMSH